MKIGRYVRTFLIPAIKGLKESDFQDLLKSIRDGSAKRNFGLHNTNIKLLIKESEITDDLKCRYYKEPIECCDGFKYRLTSQWYDDQFYKVSDWIEQHSKEGNDKDSITIVNNVSEFLTQVNYLSQIQTSSSFDELLDDFRQNLELKLCLNTESKFQLPESVKKLESLEPEKRMLLFRGHSNVEYKMIPGIRRQTTCDEDFLFKYFESNLPEYLEGKSNLGKLAFMQHCEYSTRLLDVTENPLVALYFACQSPQNCKAQGKKIDGEVLVLSPEYSIILYERDDVTKFLSALPLLNKADKRNLLETIIDAVRDSVREGRETTFGKLSDKKSDKAKEIKCLLKKGGFEIENDFDLLEVLFPRIVRCNTSFERIKRQNGLFIMDSLYECQKEGEDECGAQLVFKHIRIPCEKKESILEELNHLGINDFSLFPDPDHFVKYVNKWLIKK